MHEYTNEDARRAQRRHERRSTEERIALLGALLCSAGFDKDPSYAGIDPDRGPYEGPPIWHWALKSLAYYAANALSRHSDQITESAKCKVREAIDEGLRMASEHKAVR